MKKYLLTTSLVLGLACYGSNALANGTDHTCQGGHNCNGTTFIDSGNISNTIDNSSSSSATGGNSSSTSNSASTSSATGGKGGKGGSSASSSNSNVNVDPAASSAFAAPLTSSNDTCMGSTSVGGQAVGFGLSLGSTWEDEDCRRRKNARFMFNMGQDSIALAMMCQDSEVYHAVMVTGNESQKAICKNAVEGDETEEQINTASKSRKTTVRTMTYND